MFLSAARAKVLQLLKLWGEQISDFLFHEELWMRSEIWKSMKSV